MWLFFLQFLSCYHALDIAEVPGYQYQGCYIDYDEYPNRPRDLAYSVEDWNQTGEGWVLLDNTPFSCARRCDGYKYFALQWGCECFCGNKAKKYGLSKYAANCYKPCTGNESLVCGGRYLNSLYQIKHHDHRHKHEDERTTTSLRNESDNRVSHGPLLPPHSPSNSSSSDNGKRLVPTHKRREHANSTRGRDRHETSSPHDIQDYSDPQLNPPDLPPVGEHPSSESVENNRPSHPMATSQPHVPYHKPESRDMPPVGSHPSVPEDVESSQAHQIPDRKTRHPRNTVHETSSPTSQDNHRKNHTKVYNGERDPSDFEHDVEREPETDKRRNINQTHETSQHFAPNHKPNQTHRSPQHYQNQTNSQNQTEVIAFEMMSTALPSSLSFYGFLSYLFAILCFLGGIIGVGILTMFCITRLRRTGYEKLDDIEVV